jgi:L-ascorbate metabolism protein UlaG (beta-lactamase superfamily)
MTMGESGAVEAVKDLNPKTVIPIHLGLVPRSPLMRTKDSVEGFTTRLKSAGLSSEVIDLPAGESYSA